MKLLDILLEIGEANLKPYKYSLELKNSSRTKYTFTTDSKLEYTVNMYKVADEIIIDYKVKTGSHEDITNKGEQYRIMSTVVACIKEYLSKNPKITKLSFAPSKSKETDNRRFRMYAAYVQKQLPGSKINYLEDDEVTVELPKKGKHA
jgi:hypothetical protein